MSFKNTKFYAGICKTGDILKKNSPQIMIVTGVASLIAAGVWACKKTCELDEKLTPEIEDLEDIKNSKEELIPSEYRKDIAKKFVKIGAETIKIYGGPVALAAGGAALILGGSNVLSKRNAVLTGAYGALKTSFDGYRGRVKAKLGEEAEDAIWKGVKEITTEETKVNKKTGEEKVVEKKGEIIDDTKLGAYSFIYGSQFTEFKKNARFNYMALRNMQATMNSLLQSRAIVKYNDDGTSTTIRKGKMFLYEVLLKLGLRREDIPDYANIVGWLYDPNSKPGENGVGDNFIDFGVLDLSNERFINSWEDSCLLNFNCDGIIYDKI